MKQIFFHQTSFTKAYEQSVTHLLLALGSNHMADRYLPYAHNQLAQLGQVTFSGLFLNPDFTATKCNQKPDYSNQCAILTLQTPANLGKLNQRMKQIEQDCDRQNYQNIANQADKTIRLVTLDIDILAIKLNQNNCENKHWTAIKKRYPFKKHEWVGVNELLGLTPV